MKARTTAGILTCMVLLAAVTASMQADTINTDFTEASFGDIGLVKDIPNPGIATIDLDTLEDRLQIQGTAGMNMWTARADAPIAYILKPTGSLWFAETEVELDDPSLDRQITGLTVYSDADGAKPDFTFSINVWVGGSDIISLQGLGDNNPNVSVSAGGATNVVLRMEVKEDIDGAGHARYTFKYDLLDGSGMQTLTTYDSTFDNSRVGVYLKTERAQTRTVYFNSLEIGNMPDGPKYWWKMDEASGHSAADSGYEGADGVVTNSGGLASPVHTWVTPANSRAGNALDVSSGWGYVDAGNLPIAGSFSVNIWVDPHNVNANWIPFISKWNSSGGTRLFWLGQHSTNGRIRFGISSTGANELALDVSTLAIGNHCWQMVTAVWDETTKYQKVYVNGVLRASIERAAVTLSPVRTGAVRIMAFADNTNQFPGTVDDVRIYDRALSDDEVRALYANPGVEAPTLTMVTRDFFDGPSLEEGWTEDDRDLDDAMDLASRPGWLRMGMNAGQNSWTADRSGSVQLYTDAPDGNFTLETRVDIATGNGGSLVAQSQGGLVVCDPSYSTAQNPWTMSLWLGSHNGSSSIINFGKPGTSWATLDPSPANVMSLRLYRDATAGTWEASYRVNPWGAWTVLHTASDADMPSGDVSDGDIYVGLTGKTWGTNAANIDFDEFEIPEHSIKLGTTIIVR